MALTLWDMPFCSVVLFLRALPVERVCPVVLFLQVLSRLSSPVYSVCCVICRAVRVCVCVYSPRSTRA